MGRGIRSTDGTQGPRRGSASYPVLVDVHDHSRAWADGSVIPWCAVICPAPEAPHYNAAPRMAIGDSVNELWYAVHDQLGEVGDEVGMIVSSRWSLEGDIAAWKALCEREGLQRRSASVPLPRTGRQLQPRHTLDAAPHEESPVAPVPLFRPERGEGPPFESVDLYLDPPASLSKLWLRASHELPPADALKLRDAVKEWRSIGVQEAIKSLQEESGYVKRGEHAPDPTRRQAVRSPVDLQWERTTGFHARARLELTAVAHDDMCQADLAGTHWLHEHIYIGTTAEDVDGSGRWPLNLGVLYETALIVQTVYCAVLRTASRGLRWEARHHLTGEHEIVAPSFERDLLDRRGADDLCSGVGTVRAAIRPGRPDCHLNPYRRGR